MRFANHKGNIVIIKSMIQYAGFIYAKSRKIERNPLKSEKTGGNCGGEI